MKKQENTPNDVDVVRFMAPVQKKIKQLKELDKDTRKKIEDKSFGGGGLAAMIWVIAAVEAEYFEIIIPGIFVIFLISILIAYSCFQGEISRIEHFKKFTELKRTVKLRFEKKTRTLFIAQRGPELRWFIDLAQVYDNYNTYVPEKTHIGAVTVGGVTSGGIYKTGGYTTVNFEKKKGYCKLKYYANGKTGSYETVRRIQLTDELYEEAQNSPISQYLDAKNKQIIVEDDVKMSEYETQCFLHDLAAQTYDSRRFKSGDPTFEKGHAIKGWLYNTTLDWQEMLNDYDKI